MARRKSKAKRREEAIQSLVGLSGMSSFVLTYYVTKVIVAAVIVGILVIVAVIAILLVLRKKKEDRLKRSGINEIDQMDGIEFEKYLGHLLKAHGYTVKVTKAIGDFGADLIITNNGIKTIVQAKRYTKNVGIKAVQEAQAAIAYYSAHDAWVITNSDYTEAAYQLAKSNNVRLINREALIQLSLAMNESNKINHSYDQVAATLEVANEEIEVSASDEEHQCPRCQNQLVLRKGPRGQFHGCSNFPKCRFTREFFNPTLQ